MLQPASSTDLDIEVLATPATLTSSTKTAEGRPTLRGRQFIQEVLAAGRDLGVQGTRTSSLRGRLRRRNRRFEVAEEALCLDRCAIGGGDETLEPLVDAERGRRDHHTNRRSLLDLDADVKLSAAAGFFAEAASTELVVC